MKNYMTALMLLVLFAFSSCEKAEIACGRIPAKIIRYDCDRVIFQLQTDVMIGDPSWEDVHTGQRYSNVVSYANTCRIAAITNGEMTTLYLELNEGAPATTPPDCYQCLAISANPPATRVDFGEISMSPCADNDTK